MSFLPGMFPGGGGDILFPVVAATASYGSAANATNHDVNLPSSISAGELLVLAIATSANSTVSTPAGWSSILNANTADVTASGRRIQSFAILAAGTEGATLTVTGSASAGLSSVAFRIVRHGGLPEGSTGASGSSANPNPDSVTPSWGTKKSLWIAVMSGRATAVSAAPTNYVNGINQLNSANMLVGTARRELQASSDDPGTFTQNASDNWAAGTIAVRPVA